MKKSFFLLIICFLLIGCSNNKLSIKHTSWLLNNDTEMVLEKQECRWYLGNNYDDNYYFGNYEFYVEDDAIEFITSLDEYNITDKDIKKLFSTNDQYSKENFIVINYNINGKILNNELIESDRDSVLFYGFSLKDNTFLTLFDARYNIYYDFLKKDE